MNFAKGKAGVRINNKWGFIVSTGNEFVKPQYSEVYSMNKGMAAFAKG